MLGRKTSTLSLTALLLLALGLLAGPAMAQSVPPGFPEFKLPAFLQQQIVAPEKRSDLGPFRAPAFQNNPGCTAKAVTRDVLLAAAGQSMP